MKRVPVFRSHRRGDRGFTLIELVFALAIGTSLLALATGLIAQVSLRVARARAVMREQALHEAATRELGDWLQRAEYIAVFATRDDQLAAKPALRGRVLALRLPAADPIVLEFQPADECGEPAEDRGRTRAGRILRHDGGPSTTVWLDLVNSDTAEIFDYRLGLPNVAWELVATRTGTGWKQFEASRWRVAGSPLRMR